MLASRVSGRIATLGAFPTVVGVSVMSRQLPLMFKAPTGAAYHLPQVAGFPRRMNRDIVVHGFVQDHVALDARDPSRFDGLNPGGEGIIDIAPKGAVRLDVSEGRVAVGDDDQIRSVVRQHGSKRERIAQLDGGRCHRKYLHCRCGHQCMVGVEGKNRTHGGQIHDKDARLGLSVRQGFRDRG